jgi:hypothetical protein
VLSPSVKTSRNVLAACLPLKRQPLSVRNLKGTCTFHLSTNFLRIWLGTRKAVPEPARPMVCVGCLQEIVRFW